MIIATVYASKPGTLETGTCDPAAYSPANVLELQRQFSKWLPEALFFCLTDTTIPDVDCIPLRHDWGGWWSKIELFAQHWPEPVLYCDLDNIVVGDVSALGEPRDGFVMTRDWDYNVLNSSLMYWSDDYRWIYKQFAHNPIANAENFREMPLMGDQGYIASALETRGIRPAVWQELLPGFFGSRWSAAGARMILWHGYPKPWQLTGGEG